MDSNRVADLPRDLEIVESMVADLKPYLLGGALYGVMSERGPGRQPYPPLTVGGLLLRLHRMGALRDQLSPDERSRLGEAQARADEELSRWRTQTEEKVGREVAARLHAWTEFLNECDRDYARYVIEYPTQVEARTIIALLLDFAGKALDERGLLARLQLADQLLREMAGECPFVWSDDLAPAYPQERFWWLYVCPQPEEAR